MEFRERTCIARLLSAIITLACLHEVTAATINLRSSMQALTSLSRSCEDICFAIQNDAACCGGELAEKLSRPVTCSTVALISKRSVSLPPQCSPPIAPSLSQAAQPWYAQPQAAQVLGADAGHPSLAQQMHDIAVSAASKEGATGPEPYTVPAPETMPGVLRVQNDITMNVHGDYYSAPRIGQADKAWLRGMLTEEEQQESRWLREQMGLPAQESKEKPASLLQASSRVAPADGTASEVETAKPVTLPEDITPEGVQYAVGSVVQDIVEGVRTNARGTVSVQSVESD